MGRSIKQKTTIYNTLKGMKTHPTIKELYEEVRKKDSSVGQATIYRNINKMYEEGLIRKINTGQDIDRYDGDLSKHYHLICKKCGKLVDIEDDSLFKYIEFISENQNIEIDSYELILSGVCQKCGGKIEEV